MTIDKKTENAVLGRMALLLTTIIWGTSFVVLKDALDQMPTLYVLAFRFTGAALLLFLLGMKDIKKLDKSYFTQGVLLGIALFIAYAIQTFGLSLTTPGKNAFLTTTYCIITPFLFWITDKKRPDAFNIMAAVICVAGVGLVSLHGNLSINLGDILTICCGLFFAIHIVLTGKFIGDKSVLMLTAIQFATAAILAWVTAIPSAPFPEVIETGLILRIAYLCIFCTAACFALQTFGQKFTPPSSVAVIMTLESVFGAAISAILGYETLSAQILLGFLLIFLAVLISETKLSFLKKREKTKALK